MSDLMISGLNLHEVCLGQFSLLNFFRSSKKTLENKKNIISWAWKYEFQGLYSFEKR